MLWIQLWRNELKKKRWRLKGDQIRFTFGCPIARGVFELRCCDGIFLASHAFHTVDTAVMIAGNIPISPLRVSFNAGEPKEKTENFEIYCHELIKISRLYNFQKLGPFKFFAWI